MDEEIICDHCDQRLHRDVNGYWVGADETSECPAEQSGHSFLGEYR